jgi:hypothetical protein
MLSGITISYLSLCTNMSCELWLQEMKISMFHHNIPTRHRSNPIEYILTFKNESVLTYKYIYHTDLMQL